MAIEDPCMTDKPCQARNYFLACCAVLLAQGQTLLGTVIRSGTVKNYLTDACQLFRDLHIHFTPPLDTDYISIITKALQRYEDVPNRRSMITDDMMHWLHRGAASTRHRPDNDLELVLSRLDHPGTIHGLQKV